MTRFALDVDPTGVRTAVSALRALQTDVQRADDLLGATQPQLTASWQGAAASALTAETASLRSLLQAVPGHVDNATAALRDLADAYEGAVEDDLRRLNAAWDLAHSSHRRDVEDRQAQEGQRRREEATADPLAPALPPLTGRTVGDCDADLAAAVRRLEEEFADLHRELRERTRRAAAGLAEATAVPVPSALAAFYGAAGWSHGIVDWLSLTGAPVALPLTALEAALNGPLPDDSASLGRLLDTARAAGLPPTRFAKVLEAFWQARGLEAAGIDLTTWRPELGTDANRDTVLAVYRYYGELFRAHPELEWAGMANLVGPGFAAAFFDLAQMRDAARAVEDLPPGAAPVESMRALARLTDAELAWYEERFLTMQQEIFLDMSASHEAYLAGGLPAIRELRAAGLLTDEDVRAWQQIDLGHRSGDRHLLDQGATGLARREQFTIIGDDWDQMRNHDPAGLAITYLMTMVGTPSIPGARPPGDVFPLVVPVSPDEILLPPDLPGVPGLPFVDVPERIDVPQVAVQTTLPDFNVSYDDARWRYFMADTLPAYLRLLDEQGQVEELTADDLEASLAEQRILQRLDDILRQLDPARWRPVVR
ncbi:MAG TPA: hypothetical protein VFR07_19525 [Mycobacteriales bacterium]|nr:hypothetical protein [Mycobacteriales bacterium]